MRNLLKKNNNLHHSSDLDLQLLARRLIPHNCQAGGWAVIPVCRRYC